MLSYLYVLKVSAVCGLAPLAFQSVTAVGWLLEGQRPSLSSISLPYLPKARLQLRLLLAVRDNSE